MPFHVKLRPGRRLRLTPGRIAAGLGGRDSSLWRPRWVEVGDGLSGGWLATIEGTGTQPADRSSLLVAQLEFYWDIHLRPRLG